MCLCECSLQGLHAMVVSELQQHEPGVQVMTAEALGGIKYQELAEYQIVRLQGLIEGYLLDIKAGQAHLAAGGECMTHQQTAAAEVRLLFVCDKRVSFNGPLLRLWCSAHQPGEDQYQEQDAHQQGQGKLLATGYVLPPSCVATPRAMAHVVRRLLSRRSRRSRSSTTSS